MSSLRKPHPVRSEAYLAWIRLLPCVICKKPSEASHHGSHGLGTKADDLRTLPLCYVHHRTDPASYERLGPEEFERYYNLDVKEEIIRLICRYWIEVLGLSDD